MNQEPQAEISIDKDLVKKLIRDQFPNLSNLKLSFVDEGWDNVNYKLGSEYLVRLPRRKIGAELIKNEISYLKDLAPKLSIPIPAPIFVGQPGDYYKWNWTILPWFAGQSADLNQPKSNQANELVGFLKTLHSQKIDNPPSNVNRGVPLIEKEKALTPRISRLKAKTDCINFQIDKLWNEAINADLNKEKKLLHGDLHARNIVVDKGVIKAIIDWGDICSGDPATDLASLWMLFNDKAVRDEALRIYGVDEALKKRSVGWAVYFATVLLDTGMESNLRHAEMGRTTFNNLMTEN